MVATGLPLHLSSFIGREAELERGERLLGSSRLLTLTGPGGAGKTRLAVELCGRRAGETWFADLGSVNDEAGVGEAVAAATGVPVEQLAAELRDRDGLLVLDNCEHVLAPAARLAITLLGACSRLAILATSQEPLGIPGEVLLRLSSLGDRDALALFADRLRQGDPALHLSGDRERLASEICRRLDNIPLAIELAAARARGLPLADLLAGLEDRFQLLVGSSRTAPTRQQTLEAAVAWSHGLMTEEEKTAFRRLSVLPGSFPPATARELAAGAGLDLRRAPLVVAELVDRSLLELAGDRYRMAETLRAYGRERLREAAEEVDVLCRAAEEADRRGAHRASLGLAREAVAVLDAGDARTAAMLDLLAKAAERVGDYTACAGALERLRLAPEVVADPLRLAEVEMRLSSAIPLTGAAHDTAREAAARARAIYEQAGDLQAVLQVDNELAWMRGYAGDLEGERREAEVVLARARELAPGGPAHVHSLGSFSVALLFLGRFAEAEAAIREALALTEREGDLYQAGWYTGILGQLVATRDGPLPALRLLSEARPRFEEYLDPVYLEAEAVALYLLGDPRRALDHHGQAAATLATHGFRGAWNLALAAYAAAELGEVVTAETLSERSRALLHGREVFVQSKGVRLLAGAVRCSFGDRSGLELIEAAADGLLEMGARPWAALALRSLADARRELEPGRAGEAEAAFQAALTGLAGPLPEALRSFGTPAGSEALAALGCAALGARSLEAEGKLEEAAAAYERLGLRRRADRALAALAASGGHPASPVARELARTIVFEGLPASDLESLAAAAVRADYHPGEAVQRRFETARDVCLVVDGRVRLGNADLATGDLFGERSLLAGESWAVDATAVGEVQVLKLPAAAVLEFARGRDAVAERLLALLRQRLRQEAAAGAPEPPDVAARVLSSIERKPPGFEILPVLLDAGALWLLRPQGAPSWRVDADPAATPGETVGAALREAGLPSDVAHSTSWRSEGGRLVLTYLAVLGHQVEAAGFERVPVGRTDLARGSAHDAPPKIEVAQVVEHGLRHLSWLSRDDRVIAEALTPAWVAKVAEYTPEPFRALG